MHTEKEKKPVMETRGLSIGYRGKKGIVTVAEGIGERLMPGELVCLLGPNGAGKSTLMRTLAGFIPPLKGEIILDGRALREIPAAERAKLLAVVLTERPEVENMTVRELIGIGRAPHTGFFGRLGKRDHEVVEESMKRTGIEALALRKVNSLSDGERQKAMIAKALAQEAPLILLDEPTAFLDYPSKVETMRLLRRLTAETGLSVLLSTHDLEVALQLADRVWLMDKSRQLHSGTPQALSDDGSISRCFRSEGLTYDADARNFRISQ